MKYLTFSFWFILIHTVSYTVAGILALKISKDLYEERKRVLDFVRDMSEDGDRKHVEKWFLPAQILRGFLLSLVFYPILGWLGEVSFVMRILFFSGLMFVYTDVGSAIPFPHSIEGFVYMKPKYIIRKAMGKLYLETMLYSVFFGILLSSMLVMVQ